MRFRIWWWLILLVVVPALHAGPDLSSQHARAAQALLGPAFWSRVVRIENDNRRSPYPRELHVLVFELNGILWLYSDVDGTQSLSLYRNHVAEDKADLGPLLRAIDPGFRRWAVVDASSVAAPAQPVSLPSGCFVESLAAWYRLSAHDSAATRPMLLSFYTSVVGKPGHTVLAYARGNRVEIVDPTGPVPRRSFPLTVAKQPLALARAFAGDSIFDARVLPLPTGAAPDIRHQDWAGADAPPDTIHRGT